MWDFEKFRHSERNSKIFNSRSHIENEWIVKKQWIKNLNIFYKDLRKFRILKGGNDVKKLKILQSSENRIGLS